MRKPTSLPTPRRIATEAVRAGVSQGDVAAHIGLSQAAMSRRMHGEVEFRLGELQKISAFLGVPLEQLLAAPAEVPA